MHVLDIFLAISTFPVNASLYEKNNADNVPDKKGDFQKSTTTEIFVPKLVIRAGLDSISGFRLIVPQSIPIYSLFGISD